MGTLNKILGVCGLVLMMSASARIVSAQESSQFEQQAKRAALARQARIEASTPARVAPATSKPRKPGKPAEGDKPNTGTVTRADGPGFTADPSELDIQPDTDGRVQFSWHGQKWRDVL